MPLLLLLDFSNHVFAEMDAVVEDFLAENVEAARALVSEFNELQRDDPDMKAERSKLEYKLRRLLGEHAKAFKSKLTQDVGKDKVQLLQPGKQQPRSPTSAGTDSSTGSPLATAAAVEQQAAVAAAAEQLQETLQQEGSLHLVVVTDAGKRSRWTTQQLVVAKAKQLAEQLGVADEEFSIEATAAAPQTAAEQQLQEAEEEQQAISPAADVQQAAEDDDDEDAAEKQLDSDVSYRLKGALLFIARYTLEQALLPGKPLLVPGCTADEAIAAIVAANAALPQPHPLCIKSDDSDFWQLRGWDSSSSNQCLDQEQQQLQQEHLDHQQQQQVDEVHSEHVCPNDTQEDCNQDQQQHQQQDSDDLDQQQQQQWLFQCGIKWSLCCTAASMPRHHLHKCALLGKGREDLLQCGTAFGPVPAGLTVEDAAGTLVQGQARPGDDMYLQQYAAFDAAVRGEAAWSLELPALLEWLQQFRHQSPAIRARFLVKMVQHSIEPSCKWSAMPEELQDTCRKAAADLLAAVPQSTTCSSSSSNRLLKQQQADSANAAAGSSCADSKGSSSRKKKSSGNKKKQKKHHRHR